MTAAFPPTASHPQNIAPVSTDAVPAGGDAAPVATDAVQAAEEAARRAAASGGRAELRLVLELMTTVQRAPDRLEAAQRLAAAVAAMLPGSEALVLYGGRDGCRRIVSHQLGRLPSESPRARAIRQRADDYLGAPAAPLSSQAADAVGWREGWRMPLAGPAGQRASLLIGGSQRPPAAIRSLLGESAETLGGAVWARPGTAPLSRLVRLLWTRRRLAGVILVAVLVVGLFPMRHRAHCRLRVEPVRQRIVTAPFEAALLRSSALPGDAVEEGEILAELDGRELRIEREALTADLQQARKRQDAALANGKVADAQLAELESHRLERRVALVDQRLKNLQIRSPIEGVVVSGRLDRSEGAVFSTGQAMLEIAPLDRMRLELEIEETDYRFTSVGSPVEVSLDALPSSRFGGPLERIYPEAEIRDGRGVFIGVREVDNAEGRLRPGMRGRGTVYGPRRPLAWLWARRGIERIVQLLGWS